MRTPASPLLRSRHAACAQDAVFSAAYSGERAPYSPTSFLHSWWRHAENHLAGYQQNDAHEFYLYTLSGLGHSMVAPPPADDRSPGPRLPGEG
jgi:Ubiquitin carboxyl-terminal hydrolase